MSLVSMTVKPLVIVSVSLMMGKEQILLLVCQLGS